MFKSKARESSKVFAEMTARISNVNELIKMELISIEVNKVKLYRDIWGSYTKVQKENWIKNIYIYCCTMGKHKNGDVLLFEEIETGENMGRYENKKAIVEL